jgi:hypothetical protein
MVPSADVDTVEVPDLRVLTMTTRLTSPGVTAPGAAAGLPAAGVPPVAGVRAGSEHAAQTITSTERASVRMAPRIADSRPFPAPRAHHRQPAGQHHGGAGCLCVPAPPRGRDQKDGKRSLVRLRYT